VEINLSYCITKTEFAFVAITTKFMLNMM